jgi:hypothetical protein
MGWKGRFLPWGMILRLFLHPGRVEESFAGCVECTILRLYTSELWRSGKCLFDDVTSEIFFLLQVGWTKNEKQIKRMREYEKSMTDGKAFLS